MNVVVTWMYSSPAHEAIHHAQTGPNSGSQETKNYYWRCVFLLFESSSRMNREVRHLLFLNQMPPEEIDGVDTSKLIRQYNIEIIELDHITVSPKDYHGAWNTQFIVIDILEKLRGVVNDEDVVLVLDSDMVFNRPVNGDFEAQVREERALLLTMFYEQAYNINGLSRVDLLRISREINADFPADDFIYSGGEFVCCLGGEVGRIAELARTTYNACLVRHARGLQKFNEEAHLLSYVYHVLGYRNGTANRYLKRMWTDRSIFSNIDGSEGELILWHLPAEKKRGFVEIFSSYAVVNGEYKIYVVDLAKHYRVVEPVCEKLYRYYVTMRARFANLIGINRA